MKGKKTKSARHLRQSKSGDFLERFKRDQSMVEYLTRLTIMNPAAQIISQSDAPRREGSFVRLAHAREEFEAPELSHGKSVGRSRPKKRKKT